MTEERAPETAQTGALARRSRLVKVLLFAVACLGLVAMDLTRPPAQQRTAQALVASIDLYQATLSRVFGAMGANCRFEPTCSHYGRAVIEHYGAWEGSLRSAGRIFRCNPRTADGTWDPPYQGWSDGSSQPGAEGDDPEGSEPEVLLRSQ